MKIQYLLAICFCMTFGVSVDADCQKKNDKVIQQISPENAARLDKQAAELMANYVTDTKIVSESIAMAKLEEYNRHVATENLMFPADELYNSNWDTIHVNPFTQGSVDFPESYTIDCRSFVMPIDNKIRITSKYGPRRRRMHRGIDLDLQKGDTVRAAFDGKIRIKSYERKGYGYYLVIRHPNGLETVYGHLSKFIANENQIVKAGQPIALGGNTGRSSGAHLHFETRFLGKDINPAEIIDFENGLPHRDEYVFHNIKINGKKSNIYSTSSNSIAVHRVRSGETLSHIARKYGTTVDALCRINGITKTAKLSIGQPIQFYAKQVTVETTSKDVKQNEPEKTKNANNASAAKPASNTGKKIEVPVENTSSQSQENQVYHRIQSGDNLFNLANKYGTTVEKLCELNNIQNNTILKIGQKIRCS
ncbi:MAG: peptidoglycan DD-metalloendopeptidase family protein [Tannerella sp.]|nr:peptidoglycan DD-metalloendopeptidase family protein [Tannerella sp.]